MQATISELVEILVSGPLALKQRADINDEKWTELFIEDASSISDKCKERETLSTERFTPLHKYTSILEDKIQQLIAELKEHIKLEMRLEMQLEQDHDEDMRKNNFDDSAEDPLRDYVDILQVRSLGG